MKSKMVLGLTLFCLLSSAGFALADAEHTSAADEMVAIEVYASEFTFEEPQSRFMVKWEIYFDDPSSPSATVKTSHIGALFVYTYPHDTGVFYVKEYISDTLDFDPERTNTDVRKYEVKGKAPVVTVIFEDKEEREPFVKPMPYVSSEGSAVFTLDDINPPGVLLYTDEARSIPYISAQVTDDITLYAVIPEFGDLPDDWDDFPPNTLQYVLAAALAVVAILILIIVLRRREV